MFKQRQAVTMESCTTRRVIRFTENESTGSQQSTDVCLTPAVWLSLMTIFSSTSPVLCWLKISGSDWSSPGGFGQMQVYTRSSDTSNCCSCALGYPLIWLVRKLRKAYTVIHTVSQGLPSPLSTRRQPPPNSDALLSPILPPLIRFLPSSFPFLSLFPPFLLVCFSPPVFLVLFSLLLEVGHLNPARCSGDRCKLP